ncbi:hypothetical protein [Syntrophotalea acetylenivorans]|nr:hypothetical protein [Syntrophotalea acetylenivorans]
MLIVTIWAMGANLLKFLAKGDTLLVALSVGIFALTGWLLFGAAGALRKAFRKKNNRTFREC